MLDHFDKSELPNPFAGTALAPANKSLAPLVKREPQTITVVPTVAPLAVRAAIRIPPPAPRLPPDRQVKHLLDSQPVMAQRPPGENDLFANLFTQIGDMFATLFSEAIHSAGRLGEQFVELFTGFATSFAQGFAMPSPYTRQPKPMPLARYAVPAKLGEMVFSRINNEVFGAVAQGYQGGHFIFTVPIKMYKITESVLRSMQIQGWERIK